ncbi:MAG: hypothetical protein JWQ90_4954 [Hydrocarboniphaga sp.]|uniref:hypothetical protein n=1 Tax=Hydrocarboniphaga sp. TaxID=2033016 RepID=UPI00262750C4|nr:hypothetical protein [Hydrocarboniphaga sp.]MDB5972504.1 hypothetical protein [Hydrocarboniphaga sp.]
MKKLFVHIGAPKTGTSAIQHFMLRNRETLAKQGVLYPEGGMLKSAHHLIGAAIHPLRVKRLGTAARDEVLATAINRIKEEVAQQSPHTLVISTEYFWGALSTTNVNRLLAPFSDWDLNVIVYLRRQDLLAQSLYVQAVKTGTPLTFQEWVDSAVDSGKAGFLFHDVLASWRDCGLPVSVIVRIYEKSRIGSDICNDFLETIGASAVGDLSFDNRSVNTAPDMVTTELLRIINRSLPDKEVAERVRRNIIKHSPPRALFAPLRYLDSAEVVAFMQRFDADNQKVAKEFLGGEDSALFQDPLPSGDDAEPAGFQANALLQRLIELLPTMIQSAAELKVAPPSVTAVNNDQALRFKKKQRKMQAKLRGNPA